MDQLTSYPALAALFDQADLQTVADLQAHLSAAKLTAWSGTAEGPYSRDDWQSMGAMGLFRLGMPEGRTPVDADLARSVALLSDCLIHDRRSDLDMALYVHGLVAPYTLLFHRDRPIAAKLLPEIQSGRCIMCTAYTEADPGQPTFAQKVTGGYRLWGRKWLSVNMPVADYAVITFDCEKDRLAGVVRLDNDQIRRQSLTQISDLSLYKQGAMDLEGVFVPFENVLSGGLRRLRVWNRVMSASRLLNAMSACRSLSHLRGVVRAELSERKVAGYAFKHQSRFRHWTFSARAQSAVLFGAIAATLQDMSSNRIDEAAIGGLKAMAVRRASDLAEAAKIMAGGASTLANSEIARIAASLSYHRFSGGSEAQLMALFDTSLARQSDIKGLAA